MYMQQANCCVVFEAYLRFALVDNKFFICRKRKSGRSVPPRTPEAVDGRRHIDIQTDVYLEELIDTVPESDNGTQTDAFLDRPPTPLYVPQKTGLDAATQILQGQFG